MRMWKLGRGGDVQNSAVLENEARRRRRTSGALRPVIESLEVRRLLATLTVTGTGDTIAVDGLTTLREAIASINGGGNAGDASASGAYGTSDTINFNIGGGGVKTISPTTALPTIVKPLTIDGYTQGVASVNTLANSDNAVLLVELDGSGAGGGVLKVGIAGLTLGAGSGGSTIRGLAINRFSGDGILVQSDGNTIVGNFIGTNPAGTSGGVGLGNANTAFDLVTPFRAGIYIDNADSNNIGGTSPADRNVVSGNILDNIHIVGNLAAGANNNVVAGNFVGVDAAGTGIIFTSGFFGVDLSGVNASLNTVGGTTAGARNVIGGNGLGINVDDGAHDNSLQGNFVGVGADGVTAVGNRLQGIALRDLGGSPGVSGNSIGGTVAGAGNLVANNGAAGVAIFGDPSVTPQNINNPIMGNSIFNNGRNNPTFFPGIDLVSGTTFPSEDGVNPNDFGDGDDGPNHMQNYPVLTSAVFGSSDTTVVGTLNSRNNFGAGATYRIEFFSSPSASGTGFGEGQTFLGFKDVTIGANPGPFIDQGQGTVTFTAAGLPLLPGGTLVTATATQLISGPGSVPLNTSEFSAPVQVTEQFTGNSSIFSGTEGRSFTRSVAGFITSDTTSSAGDYTASINWGDGKTSKGTVIKDAVGQFHVSGSHRYAEESSASGYAVKVTIQRNGGGGTVITSTAKIADGPLDHAAGLTLAKKVNVAFTNSTLGSFRDQDSLNTQATDYKGTIDWGDGTAKTAAKFVFNGSTLDVGSNWKVQGSHKYTTKKTFTVKITLHDNANPGVNLVITAFIKVT